MVEAMDEASVGNDIEGLIFNRYGLNETKYLGELTLVHEATEAYIGWANWAMLAMSNNMGHNVEREEARFSIAVWVDDGGIEIGRTDDDGRA